MIQGPLNLSALRAFEAAARHESFKLAAAELAVTPVAISRHINRLEAHLGQSLFERLHRRVRLTEVGRRLRDELVPAFSAMHRGVAAARQGAGSGLLSIGCEVAFARHWLGPRLQSFHDRHPGIRVELDTQIGSEEHDGIIAYGARQKTGTHRHLLCREIVFPVCSPALLESGPPLDQPSDLAHHCLLHDGSDDWWRRWFEAAGISGLKTGDGQTYFSHERFYDAAIEGRGVMMGDDIVYGDDIASGRLVRLFTQTVKGNHYMLIVRPSAKSEALDVFMAWLLAACRDHKQRMKRLIGL